MTMKYNTSIQVFPKNIIAGMFGFRPFDFFEVEKPEEREVPEVDLNV
jgi:LemA protein